MFSEEISGYAEPPRPPRTARLWVPLVLVLLVGLAVAHLAGLTKPLTTTALQLSQGGSRNLRTPASRLIGDWESDNDPMFRRVCHPVPKQPTHGAGIYLADSGSGMREVIYKIVSEDRSGTSLEMAEFLPGADLNYRARYSIAEDGQSMTREYNTRIGSQVFCQYRYIGPPTEDLPRTSQPK
jgi:hypothetical protein